MTSKHLIVSKEYLQMAKIKSLLPTLLLSCALVTTHMANAASKAVEKNASPTSVACPLGTSEYQNADSAGKYDIILKNPNCANRQILDVLFNWYTSNQELFPKVSVALTAVEQKARLNYIVVKAISEGDRGHAQGLLTSATDEEKNSFLLQAIQYALDNYPAGFKPEAFEDYLASVNTAVAGVKNDAAVKIQKAYKQKRALKANDELIRVAKALLQAKKELANAKKEKEKLNKANLSLKVNGIIENADNLEKSEQITALENQVRELETELKEQNIIINDLKQQNSDKSKQITELSKMIKSFRTGNIELQGRIAGLKEFVLSLQKVNDDLNTKLTESQNLVNQLKERQPLSNEEQSALEQRIEASKQQIETLTNEKSRIEEQLQLNAEVLFNLGKENAEQKTEIQQLAQQVEQLTQENNSLRDEVARLQNELEDKKIAFAAKVKEMQLNTQQFNRALQELKTAKGKNQVDFGKIKANNNAEAANQIVQAQKAAKQEIENLKKTVDDLSNKLSDANATIKELREVKGNLQNQNQRMKENNKKIRTENSQLVQSLNTMNESVQDTFRELEETKAALEQAKTTFQGDSNAQAQVESLQEKITQLEAQYRDFEKKNQELQSHVENLENENAELKQQLDKYKEKLESLSNEVQVKTTALANENIPDESKDQQIAELSAKLTELGETSDKRQEVNKMLLQQMKTSQDEFNAEKARVIAENQRLQQALNAAESTIQMLSKGDKGKAKDFQKQQHELDALRQQIRNLQNTIVNNNQALERMKLTADDLKSSGDLGSNVSILMQMKHSVAASGRNLEKKLDETIESNNAALSQSNEVLGASSSNSTPVVQPAPGTGNQKP